MLSVQRQMPAGKNRRLTGQPEALDRRPRSCRRVGVDQRTRHRPQSIITEGEVAKDRMAAKRRVRADDLREAALHRKPISHCIAAK
jgi:hypothetical protein